MADYYRGLTDQWGRKIERKVLTEEIAAATITGVRSPITSYPGDGLDPVRLANILKDADQGNPLAYLELAETIEERDLHYAGVLGTRKRSVSQLEVTVEAASDDQLDTEQADMVRDWLKRDELSDELFDMLDAVGKGYSFTEIIWDHSEGQHMPDRLEWRDPRWFDFDRVDGQTPRLIDENGQRQPLPAFKFIRAMMKAKSGLPVRSGLARIVAWAWMFKAFTQRDWAIFTQNFGQPIRVGKYGPGATADDKRSLFSAVANIAGDCAAIISEGTSIEFIEAGTGSTSLALYKERSDWLDQQVSKAVLGQTATTDAIAGGHAVGKEHRQVQEDIERADAKALSAIINRDLIRPWVMLNYGPQKSYPRVKIGRAEQTDVDMAVKAVEKLVPFGMKVGNRQMQDLVGIGSPADDDDLLTAPQKGELPELPEEELPVATRDPSRPNSSPRDPGEAISQSGAELAGQPVDAIIASIRRIVDSAASVEEAKQMLEAAIEQGAIDAPPADLDDAIRQALLLAELTGRAEIGGSL